MRASGISTAAELFSSGDSGAANRLLRAHQYDHTDRWRGQAL
jgi:hypothetical protein